MGGGALYISHPPRTHFFPLLSLFSLSWEEPHVHVHLVHTKIRKSSSGSARRRDFISSARVPNSIKSSASTCLHLDRSCSVHTPLSIVRIISTTVGAHSGAWRLSSHDANGLYSLLH